MDFSDARQYFVQISVKIDVDVKASMCANRLLSPAILANAVHAIALGHNRTNECLAEYRED